MNANTIFVVNDCPDESMMLEIAAEAGAIRSRLQIARNGPSALHYLDDCASAMDRPGDRLPGLVLLDLNMPGLHGFEVLSSIRARREFAWLPVVMFTTSEDPDDIRTAYILGADGYLVKPMDYDDLVDLLTSLDRVVSMDPSDLGALRHLPVFRASPEREPGGRVLSMSFPGAPGRAGELALAERRFG